MVIIDTYISDYFFLFQLHQSVDLQTCKNHLKTIQQCNMKSLNVFFYQQTKQIHEKQTLSIFPERSA